MSIEEDIGRIVRAAVGDAVAPLVREVRELRERLDVQRDDGWKTRQVLAGELHVSVDTVDRRAADGDGIELKRIGRAVRVRLVARASDIEIARLAARAAAR